MTHPSKQERKTRYGGAVVQFQNMDEKEIPKIIRRRLIGKLKKVRIIKNPTNNYVYFLYDKRIDEIVYVGQTIDLKKRIIAHKSDKIFTDVFAFKTNNANNWEFYFQKKIVPRHCNDSHLNKLKNKRIKNSIQRYDAIIKEISGKLTRRINDKSR